MGVTGLRSAAEIVVEGRVQGVGFRYSVQSLARRYQCLLEATRDVPAVLNRPQPLRNERGRPGDKLNRRADRQLGDRAAFPFRKPGDDCEPRLVAQRREDRCISPPRRSSPTRFARHGKRDARCS